MEKIGIRKMENLEPTTKHNLPIWLALIASTIGTGTICGVALGLVGITWYWGSLGLIP